MARHIDIAGRINCKGIGPVIKMAVTVKHIVPETGPVAYAIFRSIPITARAVACVPCYKDIA